MGRGVSITYTKRFAECPCKNCDDRSAECHGTCEKYAEWKKGEDAKKQPLRQEQLAESDFEAFHYKRVVSTILKSRRK